MTKVEMGQAGPNSLLASCAVADTRTDASDPAAIRTGRIFLFKWTRSSHQDGFLVGEALPQGSRLSSAYERAKGGLEATHGGISHSLWTEVSLGGCFKAMADKGAIIVALRRRARTHLTLFLRPVSSVDPHPSCSGGERGPHSSRSLSLGSTASGRNAEGGVKLRSLLIERVGGVRGDRMILVRLNGVGV